ncbi:MAG: hypothetical protein ACK55I_19815, partial [bacterium]
PPAGRHARGPRPRPRPGRGRRPGDGTPCLRRRRDRDGGGRSWGHLRRHRRGGSMPPRGDGVNQPPQRRVGRRRPRSTGGHEPGGGFRIVDLGERGAGSPR